MARAALVNSKYVGSLAAAVAIGDTSAPLADITGIDWPPADTFAVQFGDDPDDDAELCQVTRSGATINLAASFTKAHAAGDSVYYLIAAEDINQKVDTTDSRLSDARTPTAHTHPESDITNLTTDLAAKLDKSGGKVTGDFEIADAGDTYFGVYLASQAVFINAPGGFGYLGESPTYPGLMLMPNEMGTFPQPISGGEILYSRLGTLYFLDGSGSAKTVYLNYTPYSTGWTIAKNVGTHNVTIDVDPVSWMSMTPVTLAPGEYASFGFDWNTSTIERVG